MPAFGGLPINRLTGFEKYIAPYNQRHNAAIFQDILL
jgi:hypothetical protein